MIDKLKDQDKSMKREKILTRRKILSLMRRNRIALAQYTVKKIGLFGSYARDAQRKKSDIDFIVEFEKPTFDNFMGLINYLEELFGKKVELLTTEGVESIRIKEVRESIKRNVVYV